jgi:hypothetical protein
MPARADADSHQSQPRKRTIKRPEQPASPKEENLKHEKNQAKRQQHDDQNRKHDHGNFHRTHRQIKGM